MLGEDFKLNHMINEQQNSNGQNGNGHNQEHHLTTRQGHPVTDNQNLRTVGDRGPATLENYQFLEKNVSLR